MIAEESSEVTVAVGESGSALGWLSLCAPARDGRANVCEFERTLVRTGRNMKGTGATEGTNARTENNWAGLCFVCST